MERRGGSGGEPPARATGTVAQTPGWGKAARGQEETMSERAMLLRDAVPYLRMYKGRTFVLKAGGNVLRDPVVLDGFVEQIALLHQLNIDVVVVHGGGPQVSELCERLGIPVEMVNGRRITKPDTLEVVKMVLNGSVNTSLLAAM